MAERSTVLERVDHLVYAVPDVDAACADLERRLGVRASAGGQHRGRGTRNALMSIGPMRYLEIIGPDAQQPSPEAERWFSIDMLTSPRIVTWAVPAGNLPSRVAMAASRGVQLGAVSDGRRQRADGVVLAWTLTDPAAMLADGIVPFFIDWGTSPHPSTTAAVGPRLVDLHGEHPDASHTRELLAGVDVELHIERAARPSLVATFETPSGRVELR